MPRVLVCVWAMNDLFYYRQLEKTHAVFNKVKCNAVDAVAIYIASIQKGGCKLQYLMMNGTESLLILLYLCIIIN